MHAETYANQPEPTECFAFSVKRETGKRNIFLCISFKDDHQEDNYCSSYTCLKWILKQLKVQGKKKNPTPFSGHLQAELP